MNMDECSLTAIADDEFADLSQRQVGRKGHSDRGEEGGGEIVSGSKYVRGLFELECLK